MRIISLPISEHIVPSSTRFVTEPDLFIEAFDFTHGLNSQSEKDTVDWSDHFLWVKCIFNGSEKWWGAVVPPGI